jgi:hypothetical protein
MDNENNTKTVKDILLNNLTSVLALITLYITSHIYLSGLIYIKVSNNDIPYTLQTAYTIETYLLEGALPFIMVASFIIATILYITTEIFKRNKTIPNMFLSGKHIFFNLSFSILIFIVIESILILSIMIFSKFIIKYKNINSYFVVKSIETNDTKDYKNMIYIGKYDKYTVLRDNNLTKKDYHYIKTEDIKKINMIKIEKY